ncbi:hypothetical protein RFI_01390, partial [Reticulomyxa filosa]
NDNDNDNGSDNSNNYGNDKEKGGDKYGEPCNNILCAVEWKKMDSLFLIVPFISSLILVIYQLIFFQLFVDMIVLSLLLLSDIYHEQKKDSIYNQKNVERGKNNCINHFQKNFFIFPIFCCKHHKRCGVTSTPINFKLNFILFHFDKNIMQAKKKIQNNLKNSSKYISLIVNPKSLSLIYFSIVLI